MLVKKQEGAQAAHPLEAGYISFKVQEVRLEELVHLSVDQVHLLLQAP